MQLLLCTVDETNFDEYQSVFTGLSSLKEVAYNIKLVEGVQLYAITVPEPMPIPLLEKTRSELWHMEGIGVIEKVERPTDWYSPIEGIP